MECQCNQIEILSPDPTPIEVDTTRSEGVGIGELPNGYAVWGQIIGNLQNQADLMAAIQEAKDWAVVGWVL